MMPFGYEPGLLKAQEGAVVGIFDCNEHTVFTNSTHLLDTGKPIGLHVSIINHSLAVAYGGEWGTAMNTDVFNRVWVHILNGGRYRYHDWSVKADPDSVFFPDRLRTLLQKHTPESTIPAPLPEPRRIRCGLCGLPNNNSDTCASHVQWLQRHGRTCEEALNLTSRPPPTDCGCDCDDLACAAPPQAAMYLNNCKWGLHGPLEVLSRRAVAAYVAGMPQCDHWRGRPWGEDYFMDRCMQSLGVMRVSEYRLLSETACDEQPSPCGTADVAFHPFKSIKSYFSCWAYASTYGHGPADDIVEEKSERRSPGHAKEPRQVPGFANVAA